MNAEDFETDVVKEKLSLLVIESIDECFVVGSEFVLNGNKLEGSSKGTDQNSTIRIGNHILRNHDNSFVNDIVYQSVGISKEHAEILYCDGVYNLVDVGSATGTFIQVNLLRLRQGDVFYNFESGEFVAICSVPPGEPAIIDPKAFDSMKKLKNNQCSSDFEMKIHMNEKLKGDKSLNPMTKVIVESFPKGFTPEEGNGILKYLVLEEGDVFDGFYLKKKTPAYLLLSNYLQSMKARMNKIPPTKGTLPMEEYVSRALVLQKGDIIRLCSTSFHVGFKPQ